MIFEQVTFWRSDTQYGKVWVCGERGRRHCEVIPDKLLFDKLEFVCTGLKKKVCVCDEGPSFKLPMEMLCTTASSVSEGIVFLTLN